MVGLDAGGGAGGGGLAAAREAVAWDVNHSLLLTSDRLGYFCRNPLRWTEVSNLKIGDYRKWMVIIAAGTLLVSILRLWIGQ